MSDFPEGFLEDLERTLSAYLTTDAIQGVLEDAVYAATEASLNRETRASVLDAARRSAAERVAAMSLAARDRIAEIVYQGLEAQIGPDGTARWIRDGLGLGSGRAATLEKYRDELTEQGLSEAEIDRLVAKRSKELINDRARTIASYEMGTALEKGAEADAVARGATHKVWITVSANVCDDCLGNQQAGCIPIGDAFPDGSDTPCAHPNCLCSAGFVTDTGRGELGRQNKLAAARNEKVLAWREAQAANAAAEE
jgi:hypothetical protein